MLIPAVAALLLLQTAQGAAPQGLLGARSAIRELTTKDPMAGISAKEVAFLDEVRSFIAGSGRMPVDQAAQTWLDLIDHGKAVPRRPLHNGANSTPIGAFVTAFGALPRPETWPRIVDIVAKRPTSKANQALLLLFARLRGDDDEVVRLCGEIAKPFAKNEDEEGQRWFGDFHKVLAGVYQRRKDLPKLISLTEESLRDASRGFNTSLPDVASLMGESEATVVLTRIFEGANQPAYLYQAKTRELAMRVVLSNLARIKVPQWELATDFDDAAYIRRLVGHYGIEDMIKPNSQHSTAIDIYFADLLAHGEIAKAAKLLESLDQAPGLSVRHYDQVGFPALMAKLYRPILELQKRAPKQDLWDLFVAAALAGGHAKEAARRLQTTIRTQKMKPYARYELFRSLVRLHGSMGDIAAIKSDFAEASRLFGSPGESDYVANDLLEFGMVTGDAKLIGEGIDRRLHYRYRDRDRDLLKAMIAAKRFREAEKLQQDALTKEFGTQTQAYNGGDNALFLCRLYYAAGRPKDILTLLADFPAWQADDLSDIAVRGFASEDFEKRTDHLPLGFYAAWAFEKSGRRELAVQTLLRVLSEVVTCDEVFSLLNRVEGAKALPYYGQLLQVNPFEPTPRFWKADLLRKLGRLSEAESEAREAIRLDPSDCTAEGNRRFKAYQILGEILKAKGDTNGAARCQVICASGNASAKAKELTEVGLLPQAAAKYQEAIQLFPSDYAAEEGLAKCLEGQGKLKEAAAHRRRAFALLPAGFGPQSGTVEGCRNLIDVAQTAALALSELDSASSKAAPAASRAYIKGCLQKTLGRNKEALASFQRAVSIDPGFLSAWQEIARLGSEGFLSLADTEAAEYRLLALCPAKQGRSMCDFAQIRDLSQAYNRIADYTSRLTFPKKATIYRLHSVADPTQYGLVAPWLYYRPGNDNPPAGYLFMADDVREIAGVCEWTSLGGRFYLGLWQEGEFR